MTNLKTSFDELYDVFLSFCFAFGYSLAGIIDNIASLISTCFWFICSLLIIGVEIVAFIFITTYRLVMKKGGR